MINLLRERGGKKSWYYNPYRIMACDACVPGMICVVCFGQIGSGAEPTEFSQYRLYLLGTPL